MTYNYSLTITNHATKSNYFMVYQNDPTSWDPNALAVAWFAKYSNPGPNVTVSFSWQINWGFSWADTGTLKAGIQYEASDYVDIKSGKNKITLDYNGAYNFTNQEQGPTPDHFYLAEDGNIPVNSNASVGITLHGNTVYATQAEPNTNLTFSPHTSYYLAYGNYVEGDVIDVSSINNPLELPYDTGVYSLHTTLNPDNSWTQPISTANFNAQVLQAKVDHWTQL